MRQPREIPRFLDRSSVDKAHGRAFDRSPNARSEANSPLPADKTKKAPPLAAFISYAKPDFEKAQEIADQLEQHGFKCWIAPRDVRPGRAYGDEIIRGIERAEAFVLVLSSASNGSGFVSREIERAVSKNKHIFTVRIEDVQPAPALELFVSSTQWIDAFKGRLGPHVDRLAQQLADDDEVGTPEGWQARPAQVEARSGPAWRSPFVLAGAAVALLGAGALLWFLLPRGPDAEEIATAAKTCELFSGQGALAACDRAIASGKFKGVELATLHGVRGYKRHEANDTAGAFADYGDALRLKPDIPQVLNARGTLYRDAGDYDNAVADFDRAIALKEWADPYASRGWVLIQKGENDRARQDFEKALTLNPTPELKDKLHAALETMDRDDPDFKACDSGSGETAIAACDRAIATGRFSGRSLSILYNDRGYLRMMEGSLDEALADLNEAIRIDPNSTYAHWNRAEIYRHKGELTSAKADYERALSLGPRAQDKPKIEAALAALNASAGEESQAAETQHGFFGPDTRKSLAELPEEQRAKLAAAYGHVGTLVRGHSAVCNATLVGRNLILTSDYCFDGSGLTEYSFRIRDAEGRPLESAITQTAVSEAIRGVNGKQRISLAVLATPLGDEAGWVERVGGEPSVGDKLDIVALDVRPNAPGSAQVKISGAATGDANCAVLAVEPNTDIFAHRCISPEGSGGAPIFDAGTGTLVGIVGESGPENAYAYRTTAVPGLIQQTAAR